MVKNTVELKASTREETGKKTKKLRAQGLVPAVVYGNKFEPVSVVIDYKEFRKNVLQSEAGRNLIFTLKLSGEGGARAVPVKTQFIDRDAMTGDIIHLDFMRIVMDEALKTKVPVELVGVPIGVKDSEGVLVHGLREIEIKCLPGDIPDKYEVDVTALGINESVHVSDLKVSKKVEILTLPTEMVATVSPSTKEEEVVPALTPEQVLGVDAEAAAAGEAAPAKAEGKEKAPAEGTPAKAEAAGKDAKPAKTEKAPPPEKKK